MGSIGLWFKKGSVHHLDLSSLGKFVQPFPPGLHLALLNMRILGQSSGFSMRNKLSRPLIELKECCTESLTEKIGSFIGTEQNNKESPRSRLRKALQVKHKTDINET